MDKIFLVDKEKEFTSQDCVNLVKKQFNTPKVGHCGTLDPFATGLLMVCVGEATKIVKYIEVQDKEYVGCIKLGLSTDTLDITGNVLDKQIVPTLSIDKVKEVVESFKGEQEQVPPMYSAIKQDGLKLYELARQGLEVERKPRKINIIDIKLISFEDNKIVFSCICSKGTYIRVLATDICTKLGTIGVLEDLRRTAIGPYRIENAKNARKLTIEDGFDIVDILKYPRIDLNKAQSEDVINGKVFKHEYIGDLISMVYENNVIAIYKHDCYNIYRCERGFNTWK